MGGCSSTSKRSHDDQLNNNNKKKRKRRITTKRRVWSLKLHRNNNNNNNNANGASSSSVPLESSSPADVSISKSSIKDSNYFDSRTDSDLAADDFHSARFDAFSLNCFDIAPPRDANQMNNKHPKSKECLVETSETNNSAGGGDDNNNINKRQPELTHSGPVPNACLPCLTSNITPQSPRTKKKLNSKVSFKWSEGHTTSTLYSPKAIRKKPQAGSTVPFCSLDKKTPDCWKHIEPGTFKVRGKNYLRDKKKDFATNFAAFYPVGVDVFLSQRKIDHIARYLELPAANSHEDFPSILVVNIQIPLYPATIFQKENDGEGMNVVLYFKLSEDYRKNLSSHAQKNIHKFIDDETEKVKSFPLDSNAPFRDRLKILGRVANVEDLQLNAAERKLMNSYNEKPVLSRPQHEFYLGENYFEIDLDIHRFSYIARKGFESFYDRIKFCSLDFGLTIQGNKAEDLPERAEPYPSQSNLACPGW
ncbi:hypothetical protein ACFE04_005565 [Oxalis oulophora]